MRWGCIIALLVVGTAGAQDSRGSVARACRGAIARLPELGIRTTFVAVDAETGAVIANLKSWVPRDERSALHTADCAGGEARPRTSERSALSPPTNTHKSDEGKNKKKYKRYEKIRNIKNINFSSKFTFE